MPVSTVTRSLGPTTVINRMIEPSVPIWATLADYAAGVHVWTSSESVHGGGAGVTTPPFSAFSTEDGAPSPGCFKARLPLTPYASWNPYHQGKAMLWVWNEPGPTYPLPFDEYHSPGDTIPGSWAHFGAQWGIPAGEPIRAVYTDVRLRWTGGNAGPDECLVMAEYFLGDTADGTGNTLYWSANYDDIPLQSLAGVGVWVDKRLSVGRLVAGSPLAVSENYLLGPYLHVYRKWTPSQSSDLDVYVDDVRVTIEYGAHDPGYFAPYPIDHFSELPPPGVGGGIIVIPPPPVVVTPLVDPDLFPAPTVFQQENPSDVYLHDNLLSGVGGDLVRVEAGARGTVLSGNQAPEGEPPVVDAGEGTRYGAQALDPGADAWTLGGAWESRGIEEPPVSPPGSGRIYFDPALGEWRSSESGSPYHPLGSGAGGGMPGPHAETHAPGGTDEAPNHYHEGPLEPTETTPGMLWVKTNY
jgi:hypothetical protein